MGIEPTQPDEVRSRTVLKTVRATRLHPLPLLALVTAVVHTRGPPLPARVCSRKHETARPACDHLADFDRFGHERKVFDDASRWDGHQQAA